MKSFIAFAVTLMHLHTSYASGTCSQKAADSSRIVASLDSGDNSARVAPGGVSFDGSSSYYVQIYLGGNYPNIRDYRVDVTQACDIKVVEFLAEDGAKVE